MKTIEDLINEHKQQVRRIEQEHERRIAELHEEHEEMIAEATEMGGLINGRQELAQFLSVSMPRVSVLISSGRIRESRFGISLGDAEKYRQHRRTGRPSYRDQLEKG